jgi:hypothetical protein
MIARSAAAACRSAATQARSATAAASAQSPFGASGPQKWRRAPLDLRGQPPWPVVNLIHVRRHQPAGSVYQGTSEGQSREKAEHALNESSSRKFSSPKNDGSSAHSYERQHRLSPSSTNASCRPKSSAPNLAMMQNSVLSAAFASARDGLLVAVDRFRSRCCDWRVKFCRRGDTA